MGELLQGPRPPVAREPDWIARATQLFDAINVFPVSDAYRAQAICAVASSLRMSFYDGCSVAAQASMEIMSKLVKPGVPHNG